MRKSRFSILPGIFLALMMFINWRWAISEEDRSSFAPPVSPGTSEASEDRPSFAEASEDRPSFAEASEDRPNVLLVVIDTARKDRFGCYGYGRGTTPNIDKIAAESVVFDGAITTIPMTTPSHSTIMTGLYPASHLVYRNAYSLDNKFTTLAEVMKRNGYVTAGFVSTRLVGAANGFSQGFDAFSDLDAEDKQLFRTGDITTGEALGWLDGNGDKKFFMWLHLYDPHLPYDPPEKFGLEFDPDYKTHIKEEKNDEESLSSEALAKESLSSEALAKEGLSSEALAKEELTFSGEGIPENKVKAMRNAYDGEIAFADDLVGKVTDKLKEKGLYDNTAIIITSDHGEILYEKANYFGHHKYLYNASLDVPLIMKFPGVSQKRIIPGITGADIMPTLLEYLGIELGVKIDGISYWNMIKTGSKIVLPGAYFVFSHTSDGLRLRKPGDNGDKNGARPPKDYIFFVQAFNHAALVEDGFKLIITREELKSVRPELYDLAADPLEQQDLAANAAYSTIYEKLLKRMEGYFRSMSGVLIKRISRKGDDADTEKIKSLGYL
ncbi:MAG: sulfatase [Candidatus Omnitrophica bacterium]|nr:sulfatase [Candidatus Omnitrophota bacterium]